MKKRIKYQYANNGSGKLVNINEIDDNYTGKYFCLICGQELIAKKGNERIHHFAHKNDTNNCSKETYLHELGKKLFYNTYLQSINEKEPFYIHSSLFTNINKICKYYEVIKSEECIVKKISKFDLVSSYDRIEFEKRQNNFIPDLTLINNYGKRIFVEIFVTHPCEEEKINSKIKIIEIMIKDEEDVKVILGKVLSEDNKNIKFYNFEEFNVLVEPICNENSITNYFVSLKDGKKYFGQSIKQELCKNIYDNKELISIAYFMSSPAKTKVRTVKRNYYSETGINYIESLLKKSNYKPKFRKKRRRK